MLHLCYSNRLEVLTAPIAERIKAQQQASPLEAVRVVVPHPTMGQYLRLAIASHTGQCANVHIDNLQSFLRHWVNTHHPHYHAIDRTTLQLVLFARFTDKNFVARHGLDAIADYLGVAHHPIEREARAFQIAGQMAQLFEEYSYTRRDILEAWRNNQRKTGLAWSTTEDWQRRLWLAIFDKDGCLKRNDWASMVSNTANPSPPGDDEPLSTMLLDAFHYAWSRHQWNGCLYFFGFSYLSTGVAEVVSKLAYHGEVFVYAQNPCLEFWEDLHTSGLTTVQMDWHRRHAARDSVSGPPDELDVLNDYGDTPALRLWGRPGREHIRMLNAMTECEFATGFVDPTDSHETMLSRLQRDILLRAPERGRDHPLDEPDTSITINRCLTARHEVEIVAQRIWAHLNATETVLSDEPLRFHDFAVLIAARDRTTYMSHLADIFDHHFGIPFRMIDGALAGEPRLVKTLRHLFSVAQLPIDPDGLSDLVLDSGVKGPPISDRQPWAIWINALQCGWGMDSDDVSGSYLAGSGFHWDKALQRLSLGLFMTEGDDLGSPPFQGGHEPIAPFVTPSAASESASAFIYLLRDLLSDFRFIQTERMSLSRWCLFIADVMERYLACQTEDDESTFTKVLSRLERLASTDLEATELPFSIVSHLLDTMFDSMLEGHGGFRLDGVAASALMPMRSLPFKVIFIVGLNEGEFPAIDSPNPLDLRQASGRMGDVTAAMRDRYVFLEALLGARSHLHLSYIGINASDGEPIEPSAVVKEFEYIIKHYIGEHGLDVLSGRVDIEHGRNTVDASPQTQFIEQVRKLSSKVPATHWFQALERLTTDSEPFKTLINYYAAPEHNAQAVTTRLPLSSLQHFLESPLQASARYTLGLPRASHPQRRTPHTAPTDMKYATQLKLLTTCFWALKDESSDVEAYLDHLYHQLCLQNAVPIDLFADIAREDLLATLLRWREEATTEGLFPLDAWPRLFMGRGPANVADRILLDPLHLGPSHASIILEGELERVHPDRHTIVSFTLKAKPEHGDFLPAFFTIAVLAARQAPLPPRIRVIVKSLTSTPTSVHQRVYDCPPAHLAQSWLNQLGLDMLSEFHDYRLPLSVVMQWFDGQSRDGKANIRLTPRQKTEDDRGPIAQLGDFELPTQTEAISLIESRFGFWFSAGHS